MAESHRITPRQQALLEGLTCERLSSNDRNLREVEDFHNPLNEILVGTIQGEAFEEDEKKGLAYYLVKDDKGRILCYFSLKAGLLFDKHGDLEILQSKKSLNLLIKKKQSLGFDSPAIDLLKESLDKEIESIKTRLRKWIELDVEDEKHKRVAKTFAGIEIVHFCTNTNAIEEWEKFRFGDKNRIGITIFWTKIMPIVFSVRQLIGIDYLYLFAADLTEDRNLINHYKTFMGFMESDHIFAALPIYDSGCTLLCQHIDVLEEYQKNFFNTFNADMESESL